MKINHNASPQRVFRTSTPGRFRWHDSSVLTPDVRVRDTLITAEGTPRNSTMLGNLVWSGDLKPVGDAVARVIDALRRVKDSAARAQALSKVVVALTDASYGNEVGSGLSPGTMRPSNSGSLGTGADERPPEFNTSTTATPDDLNSVNRDFWDRAGNRSITRDAATADVSARTTPEALNAANTQFWKDRQWDPNQTRVSRVAPTSIADVQRQNDEFWAAQTQHQRTPGRVWGKG